METDRHSVCVGHDFDYKHRTANRTGLSGAHVRGRGSDTPHSGPRSLTVSRPSTTCATRLIWLLLSTR